MDWCPRKVCGSESAAANQHHKTGTWEFSWRVFALKIEGAVLKFSMLHAYMR
jgi:hypothetical protein